MSKYQELYAKYQTAIKLRELDSDNNFKLLKEIFINKILSHINLSSQNNIIPYLSGLKEVFSYVEIEAGKVKFYRDELDQKFPCPTEENK